MSETHVPSPGVDDPGGADWHGPPPPRRRRSGPLLVALVLLLAALVALLAASVAHVAGGSGAPATVTAPSGNRDASFSLPPASSSGAAPLTASLIAARVDPGLVDINVALGMQGGRGSATGMVLTPTGLVLTNNHVVQGTTSVSATDLGNGKTYSATVLGYDRSHDVALLQLQGASGLQTVPLGTASTLTVGSQVTALGNAGGRGGAPSEARGSITGLGRTITAGDIGGGNAERLAGLLETNAAIRPGDSGGPLVNAAGQVVAMNAAASAPAPYTVRSSAIQGFAIPIDEALAIGRQIQAGTASPSVHIGATGFLGVEVIPSGQPGGGFGTAGGRQGNGALLGGVLPGFPAQKAGLAKGDVITAVNGQTVASATALTGLLSAHHPGDTVQLQWLDRSGQTHTTTITLASGPPA